MSKWQAPAPEGQPVHTPTVVIRGVETGSPEYGEIVNRYSGQLNQFREKNQQQIRLGGLVQHTTHQALPGATMRYHNNNGQETITLDVSPRLSSASKKPKLRVLMDQSLDGYIAADHSPSSNGETLRFLLNGEELMTFAFPGLSTSEGGALLFLFGSNALKYHSYADAQNPNKLLSQPSPEALVLPQYWIYDENAYPMDSKNHRIALQDYIAGRTSTATGPFSPTILQTSQFDTSRLKTSEPNLVTVEVVSGSGNIGVTSLFAEFFSRKATRPVALSWRYNARPGDIIMINDKPLKFACDCSFDPFSKIAMHGPDTDQSIDATDGTALRIDLSQ